MRYLLASLLLIGCLLASATATADIRRAAPPAAADTAQITRLLRQSEQLASAGRFEPARPPLAAALRLAQATGLPEVISRVLFAEYFLAHREGKFEEAIQAGEQALVLLRGHPAYAAQARILVGLGNTYGTSHDMVNATRYFQQALTLAQAHGIPRSEAQAYAGLAVMAGMQQRFAETIRDNDRALAIYQRLGADGLYFHVLINQAVGYREVKRFADSERAFRQIIRYAEQQHDQPVLAYARANFTTTLLRMGKLTEAEQVARQALRDARSSPNQVYLKLGIYEALAEMKERQGNYQLALANNRLAAAYQDTLMNEQRAKELVATETRFRTAEKQRQITGLSLENARQRRRFWWLLAGTLGLVGLMGLAGGQYRIIRKKNRQLLLTTHLIEERNQRITAQADKLTLLMRELHHRVKNNLAIVASLLRLQSNRLTDVQAVQAVRESQQRVEAMAMIHQSLYLNDDATIVDMHLYVHNLVNYLVRAYGYTPHTLRLDVAVEPLELDVDVAMPLGLIINELVTNAFKHALPNASAPALRIGLRSTAAAGLELEIEDNGPGIAPEQRGTHPLSFGNRLVEALVQQLKGQLAVENQPGAYYHLRLSQPLLTEPV